MKQNRREWPLAIGIFLGILFVAIVVASCQTIEVVQTAPTEFWITGERLVIAILADLWSIIDLFL